MRERGLKNINVFYSAFTNVFYYFCHVFNVFFWNVFLHLCFLSSNQQCQSIKGKIPHFTDLLTRSSPQSPAIFQLRLWPLIAAGYHGGRVAMLSSALWCQYPRGKLRVAVGYFADILCWQNSMCQLILPIWTSFRALHRSAMFHNEPYQQRKLTV